MFYKAVIQLVMLYVRETFALFHIIQAACGVVNCEVRGSTNTQHQHDTLKLTDHGRATCLASVDVLEEVGLYFIDIYIDVRRQIVANYITDHL